MTGRWTGTDTTRTTTPAHRHWREQVLNRDEHRCQIQGPRCTGTATEADHIIEVADGGAEHDSANGQAVCAKCHAQKTSAHANNKRWSSSRATYPAEKHPGLR